MPSSISLGPGMFNGGRCFESLCISIQWKISFTIIIHQSSSVERVRLSSESSDGVRGAQMVTWMMKKMNQCRDTAGRTLNFVLVHVEDEERSRWR
jgi:hypothetical protein